MWYFIGKGSTWLGDLISRKTQKCEFGSKISMFLNRFLYFDPSSLPQLMKQGLGNTKTPLKNIFF